MSLNLLNLVQNFIIVSVSIGVSTNQELIFYLHTDVWALDWFHHGSLSDYQLAKARSCQIRRLDHLSRAGTPTVQVLDCVVLIPTQLYGPLNQLGYIYRSVNQSLVDTEKLLALLNEPTDVNDKEDALDLVVTDGEIEFGAH